jgi:hypothetical protein
MAAMLENSLDRGIALVALLLAVGHVAACSPFHTVHNAKDIGPGEKVIVGDVRIAGGDLWQWVGGAWGDAHLVFDYELPGRGTQIIVTPMDGYAVRDPTFDKNGGLFSVGVRNQDVFIISIRVKFAAGFIVVKSFPVLVRVMSSPNRCEYVGTLVVSRRGDRISTDIYDDYDGFVARYPALVRGCTIAKHLGISYLPSYLDRQ